MSATYPEVPGFWVGRFLLDLDRSHMSKIIYLGVPAHGHLNPMLPVASELVQRGEHLIAYNIEEFRPQIEATGATFRTYPPTILSAQAINDSVRDGNLANSSVLMLRAAEALLPFLLPELEREQPELVIFDSLAVWGKMATSLLNLRAAASITHFVFDLKSGRVTFGETLSILRLGAPKLPQLLAARNRLIRRYGKSAFPPSNPLFPMRDKLNLQFTARDLQPAIPPIDATFRFVGPSIKPRPTTSNFSLNISVDQPLVYISLGTIHSDHLDFYRQCFAAFADHPAHFVLSVGKETEVSALNPIPVNFSVYNFVPQLEVLQRATLFVTHGGMNSIHEGLYYGVPLVAIPHQFEQLLNARNIEGRGAAFVIENYLWGKRVKASELRHAVNKILTTATYRNAAKELQRGLQATGGYRQAADEIQAHSAKSTR